MFGRNDLSVFEQIKHVSPRNGIEYWFARELRPVLEYTQWRNFFAVIEKAKEACEGSGINVSDHFADVSKIVKAGAASKPIADISSPVFYFLNYTTNLICFQWIGAIK